MTWLMLKLVTIDLSIFGKKEQKIGTNLCKNNFIAAKILGMRRPFGIFPFSEFGCSSKSIVNLIE